jgi:hypothetical protein
MKKVFTLFYLIVTLATSLVFAQKTVIDSTLIKKYLQSSLNQKEPLWVVDGEVYDKRISEVLKENYIESVEILRESGALVVFGLDGKDGAILVKTKNIDPNELKRLLKESNIEIIISGTISDCENKPISGADIKIINSNKSAQSDFDGKYFIKCFKDEFLVVSFIGMKSQKVQVQDLQNIDFKLIEVSVIRCK